ncbi:DUF6492 family protein [Specibacter sp. NPDC057265]|uniref:DUF6492 family protein n=1 Tax=Specibacter sp. NPDC057265 TaxID=3346075 RepID=UPI003642F0EC
MSAASASPTMEIITPSYAPDFEFCAELAASIQRFTGAGVQHTIIVPGSDVDLFKPLAGPRTVIHDAAGYLPARMVKIPAANMWINALRPWPPVRGWISQQIIKLEASRRSSAQVVLCVDSDLVLLRETGAELFLQDGAVRLFRRPEGIDESLPRHRLWVQTAQQLLGLPRRTELPLPDYICWPCAWDPEIVRAMLERVAASNSCAWETAIGRRLHFSEMILYGVYLEQIHGLEQVPLSTDMRCVNYFDETPLVGSKASAFIAGMDPGLIAAMISAKSNTPMSVRRDVLAQMEAAAND